jgi:SAM-dependent methyltransferase
MNRDFFFYSCENCSGLSLYPLLNLDDIAALYSYNYVLENQQPDSTHKQDDRGFERTLRILDSLDVRGARFVDFGCGDSPIIRDYVKSRKAKYFGIEFDSHYLEKIRTNQEGCYFLTESDFFANSEHYDFVFMGDVLEHVVDPQRLLIQIKEKLAPGGTLIVQGPLEGTNCVVNFALKFYATLASSNLSEFPPYHVSLATPKSILAIADRCFFSTLEFQVFATSWRISCIYNSLKARDFRSLTIQILKGIDFAFSKMKSRVGNRFLLVCKND